VHRFLEGNDGNAEPRFLDEEALDAVDPFGVDAGPFPDGEICRPKTPFE
jgi:hypothetical protein